MRKTIEIENKSTDDGLFKFYIPMKLKNGKVDVIEKTLDDGIKRKYLVGEASNTKIDKADERVNKSFIKKMHSTLKDLNVFVEHEHHLEKTIGFINEAGGNDDSVIISTALENEDENPVVKSILNKIKHGTKLFYSIAGRITKAVKNFDDETKKYVKELMDGDIYEVSLTALPEGNVDFAQAITKSLKEFMSKYDKDNSIKTVEQLIKALDEMMQSNGIENYLYELFWTFRDAIGRITYDEKLNPAQKKEKIISIANEYGTKIEELSAKLADLTEAIESELSVEETTV